MKLKALLAISTLVLSTQPLLASDDRDTGSQDGKFLFELRERTASEIKMNLIKRKNTF